jgi:hypothetical protein
MRLRRRLEFRMSSETDFDIAFPIFGFIHARNSKGINKLAQKYIEAASDFNQITNFLVKKDEIKTRKALNNFINRYKSILKRKYADDYDLRKTWVEVAKDILLSAEKEFPNLLSIADSDSRQTIADYKAEQHMEVRQQPQFSGPFFEFELEAFPIDTFPISPALILEEWGVEKFPLRSGRIPNVGFVNPETFSRTCSIRSFHLPIRMAGEKKVRVPTEYKHLEDFIIRATNHAFSLTEKYKETHPEFIDQFFYYLTVDQKKLKKGQKHRGPQPHTDDMQGPRYVLKKLPSGWTYLVSDIEPTVFYDYSFNLSGLNENTEDLWKNTDSQVDENRTYQLKPYEIGLMSYFDMHRGNPMTDGGIRTFVKMAVTPKIFDMFGDSTNPAFKGYQLEAFQSIIYPWRYTTRKFPAFVSLEKLEEYKK